MRIAFDDTTVILLSYSECKQLMDTIPEMMDKIKETFTLKEWEDYIKPQEKLRKENENEELER